MKFQEIFGMSQRQVWDFWEGGKIGLMSSQMICQSVDLKECWLSDRKTEKERKERKKINQQNLEQRERCLLVFQVNPRFEGKDWISRTSGEPGTFVSTFVQEILNFVGIARTVGRYNFTSVSDGYLLVWSLPE